jgi:hypothetical protein
MQPPPIRIDLDALLDFALRGVRRASVFLGLGVNAALDPSFNSYQLSKLSNIQIIPDGLSQERVDHFKEEFRLWIEAGGFRELVETFIGYIDRVHHTCLVMKAVHEKAPLSAVEDTQAKFAEQGFPNKLNVLKQRFRVPPSNTNHLLALGKARNCLVHRLGIVGDEDLKEDTALRVSWLGADFFIEEPNGNRVPFTQDSLPIYLPDGGTVCLQMVDRVRPFAVGEKVLLSTRDLAEICWFYEREARSILQGVINYAKALGISPSVPEQPA